MFGFFKKAKILKTEEEKQAEQMPLTKKVQFEPMSISEAEQLLDNDLRSALSFVPVNYYATKNKYLLCTFYYREDYSEIFMRFELRVDDFPKAHSKIYPIEKTLMRDILRKFGQNINIGE